MVVLITTLIRNGTSNMTINQYARYLSNQYIMFTKMWINWLPTI